MSLGRISKFNCFAKNLTKTATLSAFSLSAISITASASAIASVSGYVPLHQDPLLEHHVNVVMVAAHAGPVKRPTAISTLKRAHAGTCGPQGSGKLLAPSLSVSCQYVADYLKSSQKKAFLNHASARIKGFETITLDEQQPDAHVANQRGEFMKDAYAVQGQYIYQPNDYFLFSLGARSAEAGDIEDVQLEDSFVSLGHKYAQLDIGYKSHWWSPFKHSAMLISTHAPTFANISLSNTLPIEVSDWAFNYEIFVGELSSSDRIHYDGELTSGKPLLTGIHLSVSPVEGFTLGFNRIMQSGGGQRGGRDIEDILRAFFDPSGADNTNSDLNTDQEFGNQVASLTSRFDFGGETPFAIYFEYGGEDTSRGSNFRLGNSTFSAGVDIPSMWDFLSFKYEYSEWQRGWYRHHVYRDGLQNKNALIGHWVAEHRERYNTVAGSAIGALHHNANIGIQINPTNRVMIEATLTENDPLAAFNYEMGRSLSVTWLTKWRRFNVSIAASTSKNPLGEHYNGLTVQINL